MNPFELEFKCGLIHEELVCYPHPSAIGSVSEIKKLALKITFSSGAVTKRKYYSFSLVCNPT